MASTLGKLIRIPLSKNSVAFCINGLGSSTESYQARTMATVQGMMQGAKAMLSNERVQKSKENDIVDKILDDHNKVRSLYQNIQNSGQSSGVEQNYQEMMWSIAKHAVSEELTYYQMLIQTLGKKGEKIVEDHRAEHEDTKKQMASVDGLPYEKAKPTVDKMMKALLFHMEKEEANDLLEVRQQVDKNVLKETGKQYEKLKAFAPQGENISSQNLPFQSAYGLASASIDKLKEFAKKL